MKVLVLGGTRFFGIHLVWNLLKQGHQVTIATRGIQKDPFGAQVDRIVVDRTDALKMKEAFAGKDYDVVCDDLAYSSNDVKYAMDAITASRYIMVSSASVYQLVIDTKEELFDPYKKELIWCDRKDFPYDEIKRSAECALFQAYDNHSSVAVRFPFVIGKDDYTNRLYFYVEHIVKGLPIYIDNLNSQMSFIGSEEAGRFIAFLAESEYTGPINGSSNGTITLSEVISYVEHKTGKKAMIHPEGEEAPYNGANSYSINTEKAKGLGFLFSDLQDWIYPLLDFYIERANEPSTIT